MKSNVDQLEAVINKSMVLFPKYRGEAEERYEERKEKNINEQREAAEKEWKRKSLISPAK